MEENGGKRMRGRARGRARGRTRGGRARGRSKKQVKVIQHLKICHKMLHPKINTNNCANLLLNMALIFT